MPTKTDRILSYLPRTFRALPKPTALYSVADAFGNELLLAENSLAAIMLAHWVDHADRGAELIDDLARIAALYGLAPRPEESVEEFREHLKRYVRTFLEGTVTVQGILRVTAEALGLRIADDYADMDTWWRRQGACPERGRRDTLITIEPRGDDAAKMLFGVETAVATGQAAQPARMTGMIDLSGGADLRGASVLRLKVDAAAPVDINLPAAATLDEIKEAINDALGIPVASHDGRFLTLASPTIGPASRLEVQDVAGDVAPRLLGLLPHTYHGTEATQAQVIGTVDLSSGVDLSDMRYLRLLVDGTHLAEVDCAGGTPGVKTLDQIKQAINDALGVTVASHDGHLLTLTSPTTGFSSSIAFQSPAAQDAKERLFGPVGPFHAGHDARAAEVVGVNDLSRGVDLSVRSQVRLKVDDGSSVTVECAGENPARTRLGEIVAALTAQLGLGIASHDGRFVHLTSLTAGPAGSIVFEPLPADEDATELIFGIGPRTFQGADATRARLFGAPDLSAGMNLWARHVVQIGLDGNPSVEVDVRNSPANPGTATLDEIVAALNAALGPGITSHDGQHLILASPTTGSASRITVEPLMVTRRRRFVTRAFVTDEAAQAIFGFLRRQAQGMPGTQARVIGTVDLSRGVDLREARFLRVSVDGRLARDLDCAARSPRPRAALLDEIVRAINDVLGPGVASHDGRYLLFTSPTAGASSRIAFEPVRAADALESLLGVGPGTFRGRDATRVTFVGTVDLSAGIDLSVADRITLRVDGGPEREIACAGQDPARTRLNEIVIAINLALEAQIAHHDGARIILASPSTGENSRIEFDVPAGPDATKAIFGITPPRSYQGADAAKAEVVGIRNLSSGVDTSVARFLRLAVDGGQPVDVDSAARATDPAHTTLHEIVTAINEALKATVASHNGQHLILTSPTSGAGARLDLLPYTAGDARWKLLGNAPEVTTGSDPTPAVIIGEADLLTPVNLADRRMLRLAVDGGRPVDLDVAGAAPGTTFLDEVIAKINAVFPGLAEATENDRLRLMSPTRGENSRLALLPLRALELIEYPPEPAADPSRDNPARAVRHGDRWSVKNEGAADTYLKVELSAPQGTVGPEFVNLTTGHRVRLMVVVRPGERAELWRDVATGLKAAIIAADGTRRLVPESQILAGPLSDGDAEDADQTAALRLPRGRSEWIYLDCYGARFNHARLDAARFAGGRCAERAVFNVSRFARTPPEPEVAVFATSVSDPPVEARFHWSQHQPGAFMVNLPADLPERFGGRFNQARFAKATDAPEMYHDVVTEPLDDADHLVTRVNAGSTLVMAAIIQRVPLGFEAVAMPFRRPRSLTGGTESEPARMYLAEKDVPGFIELSARRPGAWGNAISVAARKAGPARFDVTVSYEGARFECARLIALGGEQLPPLTEDLLRPGPVGILQAKAAGVHAQVSRDRAESNG